MRYNQRFPHLCLCVLTRTGLPHIYNCPSFSKQDPLSGGAVKNARPQDAILRGGQEDRPPVPSEPPHALML